MISAARKTSIGDLDEEVIRATISIWGEKSLKL
jgi:hypothetical protein